MATKKGVAANAKIVGSDDAWEKGRLGCEEAFVRRAGADLESMVDESLGLQAISIRLPKSMIDAYKLIAAHHGIGYQPLMRDILQRFVPEGLREVLEMHEQQAEDAVRRMDQQKKVA